MIILLILLLTAGLGIAVVCGCRNHKPPTRDRQAPAQQAELFEKRTELYELLLYAQKKYRETGEIRFLEDAQNVQTQILDCDRGLREMSKEV